MYPVREMKGKKNISENIELIPLKKKRVKKGLNSVKNTLILIMTAITSLK